jgi:hypothetical protein
MKNDIRVLQSNLVESFDNIEKILTFKFILITTGPGKVNVTLLTMSHPLLMMLRTSQIYCMMSLNFVH